MSLDVAVIGAGMAGLASARTLAAAGHSVQVFDKGRGIGGRLSTRRTDYGAFDHGAQYATVRDPAFSHYIAELQGKGALHVWDSVKPGAMIGKPGMAGLVKAGFEGQDAISVVTGFEVAHIGKVAEGYVLSDKDGTHQGPFDKVIVTAPAPQAQVLLASFGDAFAPLANVVYAPSYTLLAAFDKPLDLPDVPELSEASNLASACRQSARGPGRDSEHDLWVVQASADFSKEHIEREREAMVPVLLRLFQEAMGVDVPQPVYGAGHRWRYALVEKAAGAPYLLSADGSVGVAGDGMLGPRIELAFLSGAQCASAML
ncbi:MAG: NAD(P)/FAD-dependent oxidoreductase [Devosiaceae bacterium]